MNEGPPLAKLLQGLIAGMILREVRNNTFPILLDRSDPVSPPVDENGNYRDHLIVTTFSGIKLRVTVEVHQPERDEE